MKYNPVIYCLIFICQCTGTGTGRENTQEYIETFAPTSINYSSAALTFLQGLTLSPVIPTVVSKMKIDSCSIAPSLPAGMAFDTTSCAISGAPASTQVATTYTVTAANAIGSRSTTISITVVASLILSCQSNSADASPTAAKCTDGLAFTNETGTNTTLTFTVRLSSPPPSDITLAVASSDPSEARLATTGGSCNNASSASQPSCNITFTTSNWNSDQTIKIIAFNDFVSTEGATQAYNITIAGAVAFQGITSNQMPNRLTFVTTNTSTGNLGGVTGADSFCMNDPGHPDAALPLGSRRAFKAFITTTGGTIRQWDNPFTPGRIDWVMGASTNYFRIDGTTLITTTNATQNFSTMNNSVDGTANESWLGFMPGNTWTAYIMGCGAPCPLFTGNCNNFTNGTSGFDMRTLIQNTAFVGSLFSSGAVRTCDVPRRLWCIQQ